MAIDPFDYTSGTSWAYKPEDPIERARKEALKPLSQRLREKAEALRKTANQFKGCTFYGEWPGTPYLEEASLLDQAADELERAGR